MITDADAKELIDYIRQSMAEAEELRDGQAQRYGYLRETLRAVAWMLAVKAKVPQ